MCVGGVQRLLSVRFLSWWTGPFLVLGLERAGFPGLFGFPVSPEPKPGYKKKKSVRNTLLCCSSGPEDPSYSSLLPFSLTIFKTF